MKGDDILERVGATYCAASDENKVVSGSVRSEDWLSHALSPPLSLLLMAVVRFRFSVSVRRVRTNE